MWQHSRPVFRIDTRTESINDVHIINDKYAITVTQNGVISIWYINVPWQLISQVDLFNLASCVIFSCLSYNQNYLAILNESHRLTLLYIAHENTSTHIQINEQFHLTHSCEQKATCCDISKNEQYIAVGFESGQISVSVS